MKYGKLNSPSMEERCIMKQFLPKHGWHMYCWNIMFIMVLDLHSIFDDANRWTPREKRKIFTDIHNRMLCNVMCIYIYINVMYICIYIYIDVTTWYYFLCRVFLSFCKPPSPILTCSCNLFLKLPVFSWCHLEEQYQISLEQVRAMGRPGWVGWGPFQFVLNGQLVSPRISKITGWLKKLKWYYWMQLLHCWGTIFVGCYVFLGCFFWGG